MLKVAVIGIGVMGKNHARIYNQMENVELVGVADIDNSLFDKFSHITKFYTSYEDMLRREKPDAVSIAAPTSKHREVAIYCIEKGVHCLIEKPIAATAEDARKILNCAYKQKIKIMGGHIENYNPAVKKLKKIIDDHLLGDILSITTRRVGPFAERVKDIGIVLDIGSHDIGVIQYLLEKTPIEIYSKIGRRKNKKGDYAVLVLDYENLLATVELNWYTPKKIRTLTVTGSKGIAYLDYQTQEIEILDANWRMIPDIPKEEPLAVELRHFIDCIINNKKPITDGEMSYKILKLALEAEKEK